MLFHRAEVIGIAGTMNLMAYVWLVADELFGHALDLTVGRLLNHRNSAMRPKRRN